MKLSATMLVLLASYSVAHAALTLSASGSTVYDSTNNVTWLADFNLSATNRFGLPLCDAMASQPCVNPSGSMTYQSALAWVRGMNAANYLGHNSWQLPTNPAVDTSCSAIGPAGNYFGFNCSASALGSLYYNALALAAPNTAVPTVNIPSALQAPFTNFQPYLYWSQTNSSATGTGHGSFSFNTGFQGSNSNPNFLYVLPMIQEFGTPPPVNLSLQLSPAGDTVFDPRTKTTWMANANLAATNTFGLPICAGVAPAVRCVNADGSMNWESASQFITNMNAAAYLGRTNWQLPPVDPDCDATFFCSSTTTAERFGSLYYGQFHLAAGTPIVTAPNTPVGPFQNVQPYLYWACQANTVRDPCLVTGPTPGFEWSFSFGNGFEGTDVKFNDLYVTAYFVNPAPVLNPNPIFPPANPGH